MLKVNLWWVARKTGKGGMKIILAKSVPQVVKTYTRMTLKKTGRHPKERENEERRT